MRLALCSALVVALASLVGCGGDSATTASNDGNAGGPPSPPSAPGAPSPAGAAAPDAGGAMPGAGAAPGMPGGAMAGMPGGGTPGMPGADPGAMPMPGAEGGAFPSSDPMAMPMPGITGADASVAPMPGVPGNDPAALGVAGADPAGLPMPGAEGGGLAGLPMPGMEGMAGMPGMPGSGNRKPTKLLSLREQAIEAFKSGDDEEGFRLLHTHFAIIPAAGPELAEKMAWNPGLRRPALGPRFAVGAIYNPPKDFEDSPQPIGSKEAEEAFAAMTGSASSDEGGSGGRKSRRFGDRRRQNNGGGDIAGGAAAAAMPDAAGMAMPGMPGDGQSSQPDPEEELEFYAGELGTQLLDALKARLSSGEYGLVMQDLMLEASRPAKPKNQNDGMNAMAPGMAMPGMPGMPGADGDPAGDGAKDEEDEGPVQLAPAIVWLGTAKTKDELVRAANRSHSDVLVLYEIAIRPAKASKFISNTTKIRVSTALKDELLMNTAALTNRNVLQDREKGIDGEDPVEREVARVIAMLDKTFTATELPAGVTPERAQARIQSLIAQRPDDGLPVVVEARFYAEKGLLPPESVLSVAKQALGEEELAQLMTNMPGAGAGQMIGGSVSLSGLLGLLHGVNDATDAAEAGGIAGTLGGVAKNAGGGLGGLIPSGLPLATGKGGAVQPAAGDPAANTPAVGDPASNDPAERDAAANEPAPAAADAPALAPN